MFYLDIPLKDLQVLIIATLIFDMYCRMLFLFTFLICIKINACQTLMLWMLLLD